jgi:predicted tellurium resistance membrane protein TerC
MFESPRQNFQMSGVIVSSPRIFSSTSTPMEAYLQVFSSFDGILSLFTLVVLEIVLGVDNIIFIAIICGYIPNKKDQKRARFIGLALALGSQNHFAFYH